MYSLVKYAVLLLVLFGTTSASHSYQKKIPYIPAGTYMTGPQSFIGGDPISFDAPFCRMEEPCGYYTFDQATKRPLKWIPSWCQCQPEQDCVYVKHNVRLRTYEHGCATRTSGEIVIYE